MNDLLVAFDATALKSLARVLLMPPVPWLVLLAVALLARARRPRASAVATLAAIAGLWLGSTEAFGNLLTLRLLDAPASLRPDEVAALRRAPRTAIVVLGSGRRPAGEYEGGTTLNARSVERLRYGVWLARETGLPLAFSGGRGPGDPTGPTEAELAAGIAEREFGRPLRWREERSRDTAENARYTVAMLQADGIRRVVVVTHGYHLPRALRAFERAASPASIAVVAAATGTPSATWAALGSWLPSLRGIETNWLAWHEWVGLRAGA